MDSAIKNLTAKLSKNVGASDVEIRGLQPSRN